MCNEVIDLEKVAYNKILWWHNKRGIKNIKR